MRHFHKLIKFIPVWTILFCLSFNSYGLIKLNIETLMKNYIDEGLVLSTEFNSIKVIEENVLTPIELGEKLQFELLFKFEKDILNSGPSDLISISGKLTYFSSYKSFHFDIGPRKLRLGQKEAFFIQLEKDKKLEVYFKPTIKGFYGPN